MAKRHKINSDDVLSVITRVEELVMANSGLDSFEEIFKLVVAKIYDEKFTSGNTLFNANGDSIAIAEKFNQLLVQVNNKWKGLLNKPFKSELSNTHLAICINEISSIHFNSSNLSIIDAMFEHIINKTAKGVKGQFFTPRYIIEAVVRILKPTQNDLILDPACGSGGFLLHCFTHIKKEKNNYSGNNLFGFDFDPRAIRVAKTLLLIEGGNAANLLVLNSLLTPKANENLSLFDNYESSSPRMTIEDLCRANFNSSFKGFDIILTNPPFAGEIKEKNILTSYKLNNSKRKIERDVLFLERCVQLLKPGGRLAIVMPHNKLANDNWSYIRKWLIKNTQIISVLGLARNSFLPHTHQKAGILFLKKRPTRETSLKNNEKILFLINENSGKNSKGELIYKKNNLKKDNLYENVDHDFDTIVSYFEDFIERENILWQ